MPTGLVPVANSHCDWGMGFVRMKRELVGHDVHQLLICKFSDKLSQRLGGAHLVCGHVKQQPLVVRADESTAEVLRWITQVRKIRRHTSQALVFVQF